MGQPDSAFARLVAAHHARTPPRTGSLIVTIFGTVALPKAEPIRLSDLQDWFATLHIEPGLVRTALSRLVADGTLLRERDRKAALYRLSDPANRDFEKAAELIFGRRNPHPTGLLHLMLIEDGRVRGKVRASLSEAGFVPLAANLMIKPEWSGIAVAEIEGCLPVRAEAGPAIAARAAALWPLEMLQDGYRAVAAHADRLRSEIKTMTAAQVFLGRILLVHEFRRVVLRDPFLPASLLPDDWAGHVSRQAFDRAIAALNGLNTG